MRYRQQQQHKNGGRHSKNARHKNGKRTMESNKKNVAVQFLVLHLLFFSLPAASHAMVGGVWQEGGKGGEEEVKKAGRFAREGGKGKAHGIRVPVPSLSLPSPKLGIAPVLSGVPSHI